MNQDFDIHVEGWDELQKMIKRVPERVRVREIRKIMRRVGKPIQRQIINELPDRTGRLRDSIRFWSKKNPDFPGVSLGPAMRGKFYAPHWYLYLYGANNNPRPAVTKRTSYKTRTIKNSNGTGRIVKIGGLFAVIYDTGTMKGNNVVEKVFFRMERRVLYNQNKELAKYVQRTINKMKK